MLELLQNSAHLDMPYAYVYFKASLFFIHPNWQDRSLINKKLRVHFQVRSPTNSIATMMGRKHPKKAPLCAREVPIASLKGRDMNLSDDVFALVSVTWLDRIFGLGGVRWDFSP